MISVCEPILSGNESAYVNDCIQSNWISSNGPYNQKFENIMADYIGVNYAVSCSSCTAALHLSLLALGIGPGDEVIIPDFTLIVSANTVIQCGAVPVLVEVDPKTWCINPSLIREKISPKTKAIMVVHMYGHPCDMPAIMELAREHDLLVIEDCAESHGAEINGKKTGSFGDVSCFSFYGNKIITTGEGGMVLCNDRQISERVILLRNQAFQTPRFVHEEIGYNYRMTNIQAAIGFAQMEQINEKVAKKRWIARKYTEYLSHEPAVQLPYEAQGMRNVYWMFGILLSHPIIEKNTLMERLLKKGIETRSFFCPMHLQPVFHKNGNLPHPSFDQSYLVSDYLWKNGLYLPSGLGLDQLMIQHISNSLLNCLREI